MSDSDSLRKKNIELLRTYKGPLVGAIAISPASSAVESPQPCPAIVARNIS